jgi:hypothetical protein
VDEEMVVDEDEEEMADEDEEVEYEMEKVDLLKI